MADGPGENERILGLDKATTALPNTPTASQAALLDQLDKASDEDLHAITRENPNIDEELEELEGVQESKTSYRKQTTEVSFDESRTGLAQIDQAIRGLGYEVAR